jgi:flagellar hook-associated protein 2
MTKFMSAYNDLTNFMSDQSTAAGKGDTASIGHSPILRQLKNQIRTLLTQTATSGVVRNLSQAGVEFTASGTLKSNDTVFNKAVNDHPEDLQNMFTSSNGVFKRLSLAMDGYSGAGGFLTSTKDRMTAQIKGLDGQIASMQDRLAKQKLSLQQEFSATDSLMTSLKSQSASLSGFSGSLSTL